MIKLIESNLIDITSIEEIEETISLECYFIREIKVDLSVNADPLQVERQIKEK